MNFLNICIIEGNLTKDAEVRSANQDNVTSFSIAYNENFVSKERGAVNSVSFFQVEVWGQNFATKIAPMLKKGSSLRVTGKLRQDTWIGQDGVKHEKIFIRASGIDFVNYQRANSNNNLVKKEEEILDDVEVYEESESILDKVSSAVIASKKENSKKKKVG